jgi:tetratricopeptide (TPR) repeat protein
MNETLRKEYFDKAFKLHASGNIQEAQNLYQKILSENPDDCEVLNLIGMGELQQKNYAKAEEFVTRAIAVKKVRYFYETLAHIYFQQKNYTKELETRLEEEKEFGLEFELAFGIGLAYKNLLNFEKSEEYYLKAAELKPDSRDTYFNLANLYTLFRNPEKTEIRKGTFPTGTGRAFVRNPVHGRPLGKWQPSAGRLDDFPAFPLSQR